MINLSVINLRKLIKNFLKIILILIILLISVKIILHEVKNVNYNQICNFIFEKIINENEIFLDLGQNEEENNYKQILVAELSILSDSIEEMPKNTETNDVMYEEANEKINDEQSEMIANEKNEDNKVNEEKMKENQEENNEENNVQKCIETKVVEENNIKEVYTDIYKTVKIKNESKYVLDEESVTPNIDYSDKKDLMIYHTHTCESYTQTENCKYESSGNYRTLDKNYSVVRVGNELTNLMAGKGFTVIHDDTVHDYPVYNGSYNRSLLTINNLHSVYNTVDMIFDIHRDALGSNENYAPCVQIGDEKVAQLMFVIGTDGGGLEHSNWKANLKLAIKIQEKANEMYPGLFRPIIVRNSRYNQHISQGSAIIEVGATGNTLEESVGSMKYLANVLEQVMSN